MKQRVIRSKPAPIAASMGEVLRATMRQGWIINRQVKIGIVRGVIIGYNIARGGRYRGNRYPLLVQTELGIAKCALNEVIAA